MDLILKTLVLLSIASVALYAVLSAAYIIWLRPKILEKRLRQQGIKGTSYKLLHGDTKELVRSYMEAWSRPISLNHRISPRVLPFFHEMVQNYGNVSLYWEKTRPRLLLADPELVRLALTNKLGHFRKPTPNPLVKLLHLGVATLEGERWARRRKLMTPAFHFDKLKGMIPAFSISCSDLVNRWKNNCTSSQGTCELDVAQEFHILASDVIARAAFGSTYEDGKKIFEHQKEQILLVIEAYYSVYFPGLRFIPTKKNRRRYKIDREIKAILKDMIQKREPEMLMQNSESGKVDLLGLLLQCKAEAENDMTMDDLMEECKLFYLAGQETTANLLTWTTILLSMNPDWQEKTREEVLRICGKRTPDINEINHLKTVSMILNEVLRLYPPAPATFRRTLCQTNIGGMSIPAGVDLVLPFLFLHHDPKYWGHDAEEFKPDRFAEGVSKASNDQIALYAFGWGPRICPGQNFALIEAKLALAMILQHFWFELSPSYTHAPHIRFTLQPQHGAPIMLHHL